jgi:1,4-dihydroxy-2-naphthoate octaprenyltransferase
MSKVKIWISAMRLRTLPLSLAGIVLGSGLAAAEGMFDGRIFVLAVLTAVSYQILSNLANDYGDGLKGTDAGRVGPQRAVQAGLISHTAMKKALAINILISVVLTVLLLKTAFPGAGKIFYVYLILGLLAIWAALKYTIGKKAYGYMGLGDLFVLLFFGFVSVAGVYYLYTKQLDKFIFLPAMAIGLLSVAVLNINNMRDLENDRKAGKITLAVKLGSASAMKYQRALITLAFLLTVYFTLERFYSPWQWLAVAVFVPLARHLFKLNPAAPSTYNTALKQVSLLTFLFSVVYALTVNI